MAFVFLIPAFFIIRRSHANFVAISRFNSYGFLYSILLLTQPFARVHFLSFPGATSQTIETKNGSLIWKIPGATLAFSSATTDNQYHDGFSSSTSSVVTLHDLNTAINNSVATFEPQVIVQLVMFICKTDIIVYSNRFMQN